MPDTVAASSRLAAPVLAVLAAVAALWSVVAWSAPGAATDAGELPPPLVVYVRDGCPHCTDAKAFLRRLEAERPGLEIRWRAVDEDSSARDELVEVTRRAGEWPPGVPTFVLGERVWIGFDDAAHSGAVIAGWLDEVHGTAGSADAIPEAPPTGAEQRWLDRLAAQQIGLPLFTIALGLLDGFNPCAMWVLLFLLSMLARMKDRRRMAIVAGTFVAASGVVYFAFMAAWLNLFLAVGFAEPVRIALALVALLVGALNVKDFAAFGRGPSLSIPDAAKPGIYARIRRLLGAETLGASLIAVVGLALAVNLVELLCTAGLPAVYTAVLAQQELSPVAYYGYLALYIAAYLFDDALMVGLAVLALGSGRLGERGGRLLKLLSGLVMLGLGLVLLLRPAWLL